MAAIVEERRTLDKPLLAVMSINWEMVLFVTILVLGVITRFWDLPYRAYNHDESIHTDWSWNLYTGRGYQHNPIYHGPLLYHATALTFMLLGDNDVTGRIPNVIFGLVLLTLPFFFRKWLGRKGALVTMAMLLISPAVLYYSRFNRHDVYVEVFVLLMALAIWKYIDERRDLWLYAAAASLAFSFAAMETTFIFVAIFALFLCGHFTISYLRPRVRWDNWMLDLFGAILGIPFFGLFVLYRAILSLRGRNQDDANEEDWRELPSFNLGMVFATFSLPLLTPAVIYVLNILWQRLSHTDFFPVAAFTDVNTIISIVQSQPDVMARMLALTVAMILFSALLGLWWRPRDWVICAVLFWPVFVIFFTTVFTNGGGFFTGLLGSLGYWLSQQEVARGGQPSWYYLLVMLPEYEFLPYIVGLAAIFWFWWHYRPSRLVTVLVWILWIIVYYTVVRPFFTGLFANTNVSAGLFDELVVVWFFVLIPLTFFATFDLDNPESVFPAFIFTWVAGVLVLYSWAGEKMPWLTMHLTIPLAFASGWVTERLLNADWRSLFARGVVWLALVLALVATLLVMVIAGPRPFQGVSLDQLSATMGYILSLVVLALSAIALYWIGRRFTLREIARVAAVALVVVLAALTVRFAWLAVYIEPDVAAETMIYAQGSHDDVIAMQQIQDLSQRLCAQVVPGSTQNIHCDNGTIKVAYDDSSSWPFVWYLRNYRNAQYYGANPGAPFDAEVVIVGPKNEDAVKPYLGIRYAKIATYKLIWWPIEGYKDLRLARDPSLSTLLPGVDLTPYAGQWISVAQGQIVGVGATQDEAQRAGTSKAAGEFPTTVQVPVVLTDYVLNPQIRSDLFTAWFYHKYKESFSQWPYVANFSFYVRKDVASLLWNYAPTVAPTASQDEYGKKTVTMTATRAIGTVGAGNGQFNNPRNIAVDRQGNLYVADSDNNRIEKFDSTGKFVQAWGVKSPDNVVPAPANTFNQPWGIAVDQNGNVYVADTWNHRIQKFDSNGKLLQTWGGMGDTAGVAQANPLQFYGPRAIALDAQGNLYVTDTGNKRVSKFSPNGEPIAEFGGVGSDNGQFQEPVGIGVDAQGNIFVADTWNQRIQKFDSNFKFVTQWHVDAWDSQSVVNKPYLAVDADGNVFVTDPENARIIEFSNTGTLVKVFGNIGVDLSSFNLPTGLAFDAQGNLYVADSSNQRVLVFSKP